MHWKFDNARFCFFCEHESTHNCSLPGTRNTITTFTRILILVSQPVSYFTVHVLAISRRSGAKTAPRGGGHVQS